MFKTQCSINNVKDQAGNLDAVMDSDLNFNSHIKTIIKSAYHHLKNISGTKGLRFILSVYLILY